MFLVEKVTKKHRKITQSSKSRKTPGGGGRRRVDHEEGRQGGDECPQHAREHTGD